MASASSGAANRICIAGWYCYPSTSSGDTGVMCRALAIIDGSRFDGRGAPLAQSVEHSHGKAGVVSSILTGGSPWRRSSVGQSTRLIIVLSRVRVPPPLPRRKGRTERRTKDAEEREEGGGHAGV